MKWELLIPFLERFQNLLVFFRVNGVDRICILGEKSCCCFVSDPRLSSLCDAQISVSLMWYRCPAQAESVFLLITLRFLKVIVWKIFLFVHNWRWNKMTTSMCWKCVNKSCRNTRWSTIVARKWMPKSVWGISISAGMELSLQWSPKGEDSNLWYRQKAFGRSCAVGESSGFGEANHQVLSTECLFDHLSGKQVHTVSRSVPLYRHCNSSDPHLTCRAVIRRSD